MVRALAEKLKDHLMHEGKLPASVITFGSNQGRASFALGMPLTKNPGNTTGAPANDRLGTAGDRFVEEFVTKTSHYRTNRAGDRIKVEMHPLRQLHLLHETLHGPFSPENIALGDPSMNGKMAATEKTAISTIENDGQIRYRVDVTYHSEVRPPDDPTEIPDDPVVTVRNWVGFYIAKKITVVSTKWDGSAYSISLGEPLSVEGEIPAVTDQVVEKAEDVCFKIAQAHLAPTRPDKHLNGKVYKATSLKLGDLREKASLNQNQMQLVSNKLQSDGRFHVISGGSGPTIFVCE